MGFLFSLFCKKNRGLICILFGMIFILISGFRNISVGSDLNTYYFRYKLISSSSWNSLIDFHEAWGFEYGFLILNKLLGFISTSPYFYIFITSAFILLSFIIFIYKYSEMPYYSFFVFIGLNLFGTSMNLIRLYIACAIILFSIKYIYSKEAIKYFFVVFLASLFHSSALVMIIFYPLCQLKENTKFYIYSIMIFILSYIFGSKIIEILLKLGSSYYYERYSSNLGNGDGEVVLLFFIFILLSYLFFKNFNLINDRFKDTLWIKFLILCIFLGIISLKLNIAARLMWYTKAGLIITIPNIIVNIKNIEFRFIYTIIVTIGILIIYFMLISSSFVGIVPYESWLFL
ncbi:EpsG family protein [Turicibacter sanguinis]|uniref:EpsG family protein n=1 Tax=Turicibacter sanguinis TaxID=154288 RepID=UPI0018ABC847|nr:EpsG family protein [Turicibacter sanguinis]